jgi:hypothetical protein
VVPQLDLTAAGARLPQRRRREFLEGHPASV